MFITSKNKGEKMEEQKEDILPIKGFDGYYITRDGRVFSDKSGDMKEIKHSFVESSSGIYLKRVYLNKKGNQYTKYIHRMVFESYSGVVVGKRRVFFKDMDCLNCSFDNLTLDFPQYGLEEGEEWISGFEGRYTTYKGDVYSVWQRDYPKRLKPYHFSGVKKYTLYDYSGSPFNFYVSDKG